MDVFRFDRWDRIGTEVTTVFVWLGASASLVADPVSRWVRDLPILVDTGDSGTSRVPLQGATATERLLMLVAPIAAVVALGVGAWLTVRLLRGIAGGDPFEHAQIWRLRALAVLLIVVPSVFVVVTAVATSTVLDRLGQDVDVPITLPLPWLLAGLLTAAVAQAFGAGAALRDDTVGLV